MPVLAAMMGDGRWAMGDGWFEGQLAMCYVSTREEGSTRS